MTLSAYLRIRKYAAIPKSRDRIIANTASWMMSVWVSLEMSSAATNCYSPPVPCCYMEIIGHYK